jgi:hypothetical protein
LIRSRSSSLELLQSLFFSFVETVEVVEVPLVAGAMVDLFVVLGGCFVVDRAVDVLFVRTGLVEVAVDEGRLALYTGCLPAARELGGGCAALGGARVIVGAAGMDGGCGCEVRFGVEVGGGWVCVGCVGCWVC